MTRSVILLLAFGLFISTASFAQSKSADKKFKVVAFFTAKHDPAHISFVHEANTWFPSVSAKNGFTYDTTSNWANLNEKFLSKYQAVIFLDTRPEDPAQRNAFQKYMENGGGWMGFHFAAFALTPSDYNQDWDWYHNKFIGAGQYKSNTWRPTSAVLRVENRKHPATKNLNATIKAAPNEWYSWEKDLKKNKDIQILLSIDPSSFPLGTGPKAHEIWHEGYYPVVWTNKKYKMIYFNMGHNDMDYEGGTNNTLSYSFSSSEQNQLVLDALKWIGTRH
jgi:uncharacterized protein